jgi:hypothetical protein
LRLRPKEADFALKADSGHIRFGPHRPGQGCATDQVAAGQIAWYRLAPGLHAFCLEEIPNRRTWLPYRFAGTWRVRGRSAGIEIRERPATR